MKKIFLLAGVLCVVACHSQSPAIGFPNTDSLHRYNNKWVRNSAVEAFSQLRLNTLLHGIIQHIDSAKLGPGGSLGIDTLYQLNDSTIRYKKNGLNRSFVLKGVYDNRRKVDSAYSFNDSILRLVINGSPRDILIRGNNTGSVEYSENVGDGSSIFKTKDGQMFQFRTIWSTDTSLLITQGTDEISLNINPNKFVSIQRLADSMAVIRAILDGITFYREEGKDSLFLNIDGRILAVKDSTGGGGGFPGYTIDTGPLSNAVNKIPNSETVYNAIVASGASELVRISQSSLDGSSGLATNKIYWLTDVGKEGPFYYVGTVADQTSDNGGTIIVTADFKQYKRLYGSAIEAAWFDVTADYINSGSRGTGDARNIQKALAAAPNNVPVIVSGVGQYLDTTVVVGTDKTLILRGTTYADTTSMPAAIIVEGFRARVINDGRLIGLNPFANDSTEYEVFKTVGIYCRNSEKAQVDAGDVQGFRVGVQIAGETGRFPGDNSSKGAQFNTVRVGNLRFNRTQLFLTTITGTYSTQPAWCNGNSVSSYGGGQIGGGVYGQESGTFGIKIAPSPGSTQNDDFNGNMIELFVEGNEYAYWFEKCTYNKISGRIEGNPTANPNRLYIETDQHGAPGTAADRACYGLVIDFPVYEHWFVGGKAGYQTVFAKGVYVSTGDRADFLLPGRSGRLTAIAGSYATSYENATVNDYIAFNNLLGTSNRRYFAKVVRKDLNVSNFVPFELNDSTVTNSTFAVPESIGTVFWNYTSGNGSITLPTVGSFRRRIIYVKNITTGNYYVRLTAASDTLYAGESAIIYNRQGVAWESFKLPRERTYASGGGSGNISGTISTTPEKLLVSSGTSNTLKESTSSGFIKLAAGTITYNSLVNLNTETQGVLPINKIDATGTPSSTTYLSGDGTWSTPAGGGGGSSIFTAGSGTGSPYYRTAGPVNIGVNPSQSYAWTHWGASTSTRAVWEWTPGVKPTVMRAHSWAYDGTDYWIADASGIPWKLLTENTNGIFRGSYDGFDISTDFIDIGTSKKGDILESNGTDGVRIIKPREELLYSQSAAVSITNTVTPTSIFTGGAKTYTNYDFVAGDMIVIESSGLIKNLNSSSGALNWTLSINGYTYSIPGPTSPNYLVVGKAMHHKIVITFRGTGSSVTAAVSWHMQIGDEPYIRVPFLATGVSSVSPVINLTGTWASASTSNDIQPFTTFIKASRLPAP